MVKTKSIGIIALILVVLGTTLFLLPNEKKKIRKQFNALSDTARKKGKEGPISSVMHSRKFTELLTDPCRLRGKIHSLSGTYTRGEAAMVLSGVRSQFETITLKFYDIDIVLSGKEKASVRLTARLEGRTPEYVNEIRELHCIMHKVDKKWLFYECEAVDVIQK